MRAGGADRILHFGSRTTEQLAVYISYESGTHQIDTNTKTAAPCYLKRKSKSILWNSVTPRSIM